MQKKEYDNKYLQMSLNEVRSSASKNAKKMHDNIIDETQANHDLKKKYFDRVKQENRRQSEHNLKQSLLEKIVSNT